MKREKTFGGRIGAVFLLAALVAPQSTALADAGKMKIAFFGMELINTSPEPTTDAERRRVNAVGDILQQMLVDSARYEIVPLSDAVKQKIKLGPKITGCNGCQIDWAQEAGADLALWGTVQKVSNLILNENVFIDSVKDKNQYFGRSVDIRGNTDESWRRGMRYLVKNYLLVER